MSEKKGFFGKLISGLTKTRDNLKSGIDSIFSGFSEIDEDFYEELEEVLIMADIGVATTEKIIDDLREKVKEQKIKEISVCRELLIRSIKEQMRVEETAYEFEHEKSVVLLIGVNGVGKTTSVGKLAGQLKAQGKKVILAAADTFRTVGVFHRVYDHLACFCTFSAFYTLIFIHSVLIQRDRIKDGIKCSQGTDIFAERTVD